MANEKQKELLRQKNLRTAQIFVGIASLLFGYSVYYVISNKSSTDHTKKNISPRGAYLNSQRNDIGVEESTVKKPRFDNWEIFSSPETHEIVSPMFIVNLPKCIF